MHKVTIYTNKVYAVILCTKVHTYEDLYRDMYTENMYTDKMSKNKVYTEKCTKKMWRTNKL